MLKYNGIQSHHFAQEVGSWTAGSSSQKKPDRRSVLDSRPKDPMTEVVAGLHSSTKFKHREPGTNGSLTAGTGTACSTQNYKCPGI